MKTFRITIQDNEGNIQDCVFEFKETDLESFATVGDLVNAIKTACIKCKLSEPPTSERDNDPIPF